MTALLDHLWQSSLFALAVGILTLAFRRNTAGVRFWLWFAASVKFLVPFALLSQMGERLGQLVPAPVPQGIAALAPVAQKFSAPVQNFAAAPAPLWSQLLLLVLLLGLGGILALRLSRGLKLRALVRTSQALPLAAPLEVRASPALLEPGLVGILRPVVLLPKGLLATLTPAERDGILAHEVIHFRRRDNLTAMLHMAVESLFWFWPLVWLIGARLVAERERACDEGVVAAGHDPETYAGGILKVCRFCIRSPLACAPGVSGADLNRRIRQIMTEPQAARLDGCRLALLAGAGLLTVVLPLMGGLVTMPSVTMPLAVTVARQVVAVQARAQDAARAVADRIGIAPAVIEVTVKAQTASLPRFTIASPPIASAPTAPLSSESVPQPEAAPSPLPQPPAAMPVQEKVLALDPRGEGDPDAVTCRVPQTLPASRLAGPEVCRPNRVWAALYREGRTLAPDGQTLVTTDARYGRGIAACPPALAFAAPAGSGLSNPIQSVCRQ